MKYTYKHTEYSCYLTYIVGAVLTNFAPLLFIVFTKNFGFSLKQLSYIIIVNFVTQIFVDLLGIKFVDKLGYRKTFIFALSFAFFGLVFLATLPFIVNPFFGILFSVFLYSVGSGALEVLVSPTIEALPQNIGGLGLLHSFYCWGTVLMICISTAYFRLFSVDNWRYLCYFWAIIPLICVFLFTKVPIIPFKGDDEQAKSQKGVSGKLFFALAVAMTCSGAAEIAMSQWASLFAETGLKVSKTMGDLLGPCFFALTMGLSRMYCGMYATRKLSVIPTLSISCLVSVVGYLTASLVKNPLVALIGCGVTGLGIGFLWPGVLGLAAKYFKDSGTKIFAALAMFGDIGCTVGPYAVALVSSHFTVYGSDIKAGILFASVFPVILVFSLFRIKVIVKKNKK